MGGADAKALVDLARAVEVILSSVGEDPSRSGVQDTPARVAKMWLELTSGLREPPPEMTMFDKNENDQMVVVQGLDYWSMCEHHLVPFYGQVHIGYIPGQRIVGLSKFARVVDWYARRPQIQEAMTGQIADFLMKKLDPVGLMVIVEGTHLCMSMRGVCKPNHVTITSAVRGAFNRPEFMELLQMRRNA